MIHERQWSMSLYVDTDEELSVARYSDGIYVVRLIIGKDEMAIGVSEANYSKLVSLMAGML